MTHCGPSVKLLWNKYAGPAETQADRQEKRQKGGERRREEEK
jgi:hypothetical protein